MHSKSLLSLSCLEAQSLNLCPLFILGRGTPVQVKYLLAEVFKLAVKHLLVPVLLLVRQSSPVLGAGSTLVYHSCTSQLGHITGALSIPTYTQQHPPAGPAPVL